MADTLPSIAYNRALPWPRPSAMNPDIDRLQPYPFERLTRLLAEVEPPAGMPPINLSIGEPRHAPPENVRRTFADNVDGLGRYPATRGSDELRTAIGDWLAMRFGLAAIDPGREVLPVNGTREALFAFAQAVVDRRRPGATVLLPNPCYQIYEGAALLAGAEPRYYPAATSGEPAFATIAKADWQRCQLLYICNPGNPAGGLLSGATQRDLIARAREHDFVIAADECYSEIYAREADRPCGLLEAAEGDYRNCVVFHSLSKRSSLPGLRSGFVAGDPAILDAFARYRTYHGCAMPPPAQAASTTAWRDEHHVRDNRRAYRDKFATVLDILQGVLPVERPAGGFYLWPRIPGDDDERFCRDLFAATGVRALPGRYLGRDTEGGNPAAGRVRMALVAEPDACAEAASRIRGFLRPGTE